MKQVIVDEEYEVTHRIVKLSVIFGDAQIGSCVVKLERAEIGRGDIDNVHVGKGEEIKGERLFVKSVVSDVNDSTNNTSITYQFTGGVDDWDYTATERVDVDGDSIIYRAVFTFI